MKILIPGSFDPPTKGHLNIIERALALHGEVIVGIAENPAKKALFSVEERQQLLTTLCKDVQVVVVDGLLVDFAKRHGIDSFLRGIRNASDFEKESARALANVHLGGIETLFLYAEPSLQFISSSLLKEVAVNHHSISQFVPESIAKAVAARILSDRSDR